MIKTAFILMATLVIFSLKDSRLLNWPRRLFRAARFVLGQAYKIDGGAKRLSLIPLIFFGIVLFDFFVQQLLLTNIKTSKVVIDTDLLITDQRSLFKSPRKIAWLGGERDRFIAQNSPKNTFLHRLYHLKNEQPVRLVQIRVDADLIAAINSNVFFLSNLASLVSLNLVASISPRKFFLNQDPLFSTNNVFYRKKENSPQMHYIDVYVTKLFESGISQLVANQLKSTRLSDDKGFVLENKVYRSLESYVSQNTVYEPINFYNFYWIFAAFFAGCTSIAMLLVTVKFAAQIQVVALMLLDAVRILISKLFEMTQKMVRLLQDAVLGLEKRFIAMRRRLKIRKESDRQKKHVR